MNPFSNATTDTVRHILELTAEYLKSYGADLAEETLKMHCNLAAEAAAELALRESLA